ncbi:MAG: DUF6959 family protein [Aeoliella sp.]
MEAQPLKVYSQASNYVVIKPRGRNFPGTVIRGNSLSSLVQMANNVACTVAKQRLGGSGLRDNVEELNNQLVGRKTPIPKCPRTIQSAITLCSRIFRRPDNCDQVAT